MSLGRLFDWLGGSKRKRLEKAIFQLDLLTRKLDRQRMQLEREGDKSRTKARTQRIKGNNEAAKTYAKHYLQFQKWAVGIDNYRLTIEGLIVKLRQSESVTDLSKILGSLRNVLGGLKNAVKVPKIAKLIKEVEGQLQQFEVSKEIAESGLEITVSQEISDKEIEKTLTEIDQEITVETGIALPAPEKKVSELEKEIKKLKESRS
ncbi:MAG: Snf7 family protein [Promethearchaeota archaeon]